MKMADVSATHALPTIATNMTMILYMAMSIWESVRLQSNVNAVTVQVLSETFNIGYCFILMNVIFIIQIYL